MKYERTALAAVQEEVSNTILDAGLIPNQEDVTQLSQSVQIIAANTLGNADFANTDLSNVPDSAVLGKIGPESITNTMLAPNAVDTAKITDLSVTASKLADGVVTASKIAAGAVNSANLASNSITLDKLASGTPGKSIGFDAAGLPSEIDPGTTPTTNDAYGVLDAYFPTTSSTFVDTGLTATITPTASTSGLLIHVSGMCGVEPNAGVSTFRLYDATNAVQIGGTLEISHGNISRIFYPLSMMRYYTPGTTAPVTIQLHMKTVGGYLGGFNWIQLESSQSTIYIEEKLK